MIHLCTFWQHKTCNLASAINFFLFILRLAFDFLGLLHFFSNCHNGVASKLGSSYICKVTDEAQQNVFFGDKEKSSDTSKDDTFNYPFLKA